MTTKHSSIHLASEGSFDTTSTDSLREMRALVEEYASDPSGAVLDGWEPREGTIITEVRAISARINQNFDAWPSDELREAHHTFIGKPVFVNHNNHDPDRARGRVVASRYVDAGEEDRYVQVLQEVEASRFPMLAKELMEGGLDSVSMGAEAREVECSVCSNISTSPFDACEHIPMKGASLRTANGEETLVYEICRKISFFELSYVFDPADETAVASNVLVASRKTAELSDDEISQLLAGDGFTVKNAVGDNPKTGYMVGIRSETKTVPSSQVTVEDVREYMEEKASFLNQPDLYIGGWDNGTTYFLDVSRHIEDFEEAMILAIQTGEEAIFENATFEEYFTKDYQHLAFRRAVNEVEVPPKVDTLHPDEDDRSDDDWHDYVDDPNVIDTIDVLEEPDLGLNQELERPEDEVPEGFEEFADVDEQIEENERAEEELAQDSRERSQDKADEEAEQAQEQFEQQPAPPEGEPPKDPEEDENWDEEEDGAGGTSQRFRGGGIEAMVADDYGTFNMWVEKNGSLIASDSYASFQEAKAAAIEAAKRHRAEWAGYKDFEDCKQQNSNAEDPDAYCGEIKNRSDKESKMSKAARRKFATGWSSDGFSAKWKSFPGGEAWVATDDVEDAPVQKGGWILYDSSGNVLEEGDEGSPGAAQEAAEQAIQRHSSRKQADADKDLYVKFLEYAKNQGIDLEHMESVFFNDQDDPEYHRFEELMYDFLQVDSVDDDPQLYTLLEAPGIYGISGHILGRRKRASDDSFTVHDNGVVEVFDEEAYLQSHPDADIVQDGNNGRMWDDSVATAWTPAPGGRSPFEYDASRKARRKTAAPLDGWDMSFNDASATFQERDFQLWVATDDYDDGTENWQLGEWSVYDSTFSEVASGHENSANSAAWAAIIAAEEQGFDTGSVPASGNTNASRTSRRGNGSIRTSRTNNRDTSRRSNRMAPQRRRRIGDNNKQTPLLEETGIAQTPASEPVALPEEGDSVPNNSESDRVKDAREALRREIARERAIRARRRRAKAVGEKNSNPEGGEKVKREDLFEDFPATNMTARLRKRFATWVQTNYGCSIREASGPGELRSWARVFSREADIELPRLHAAIKRDVQALRTAADDDDKDEIPEFIKEKIDSDEDNPSEEDVDKAEDDDNKKEARRRAALRRRAAQKARNARGRRTQTTRRRRTADEKLDVAAPGDRLDVEKPTSDTTDADAEASQFDRADFDNNSGKGLEDPDNTPTSGTPGGPSVNDLGRSSARRASGLQAVKLAEAMIKVGLVEDSSEAKYKAAAQFEKMSRGQVLDRTALLEKVAEVQTQRRSSATKSAGNRGTSLNSAVPPNMSGAARPAAPQRRESASAHDSDLFF